MWLEILLTSVLGFVIYWFVSQNKEETLPLEDGWWGPGARPATAEDESIRPFKVETSEEEIEVRRSKQAGLSRGEGGGGPSVVPMRLGLGRAWGAGFPLLFSHWAGAERDMPSPPALPTPSSSVILLLPLPKAQQCPGEGGCQLAPGMCIEDHGKQPLSPPLRPHEILGVSLQEKARGFSSGPRWRS